MITPVRNISFNLLKKQSKINHNRINSNPIESRKIESSIYSPGFNISFGTYFPIPHEDTFKYGVESNFFKLPKITKKDGTKVQIQPDKSQLECAKQLSLGNSVLFDAPTGMGKTSVAHFAINKNLMEEKKTVYTVPIKALANDKYNEFKEIYGEENVGVLTGDRKINTQAPIVIMTTEIFDNQAQGMSKNDADEIGTIVYDEAHYLGDAERGIAWEHSLINAASKGVQILALSATIGNADEIASWMGKITGARKSVRVNVDSADRPVPLVWKIFQNTPDGEGKLTPIVTSEVDLSQKIEDTSDDVINLIYKSEMDDYYRKHESAKNSNPNYNNEYLKDEDYKDEIVKELTKTFGKNWIQIDFSNTRNKKMLKKIFASLDDNTIQIIANTASKSGVGILSERQKQALEVIYKKSHKVDDEYKLTNEDYLNTYAKLRKAIGKGNSNFKYSSETFKKRLKSEFKYLNKIDLDFISQMMARTDVKNVREIHENWDYDDYVTLVNKLKKEDMLPAIIFKLSQGGCEEVINDLTGENDNLTEKELQQQALKLDLLTQKEKEQVEEIITKYEKDGVYLGTNLQKDMLLRGWGVHHAGRMPQYKKLIEELFDKKLLKVVIATSTLGAGINMPARTVVMTNTAYMKYNPETQQIEQEPISANEFHQMTGRAGRRGIDKVGNVVLYNLHTPFDKFRKENEKDKNGKIDELWHAYKMIDAEPDDIRSSFRPQPVMIANHYLKGVDNEGLWKIIKQSFKVHCAKDKKKTEEQMHKKFENYTQALTKLGYIEKNHKNQLKLTPKGEILTQCQGMNPLLISSLLFDGKLAKLNHIQLAQVAAHIQGSSEAIETPEFAKLVSNKIRFVSNSSESLAEFEQTRNIIKGTEQKTLKALKESRVNGLDIKYIDSFSGLVGYLFATMNEFRPEDSIANFEEIVNTLNITPAPDHESNREYKTKAKEGNIYKIITGSISTLKQLTRICDYAIERPDLYPNKSYWETIKENALVAQELLSKEPINNNPNYES